MWYTLVNKSQEQILSDRDSDARGGYDPVLIVCGELVLDDGDVTAFEDRPTGVAAVECKVS